MEASSKTELMRSMLKALTAAELNELEEQLSDLRGRRFNRFMDLPAELRNRIYRLAIQPSDIRFHLMHGIGPGLLRVSHQIHAEVEGLYYSHECMKVEYYDRDTKTWIQEPNTKLFPLILARRHGCGAGTPTMSGKPRDMIVAILQGRVVPPPPPDFR